MKKKLSLIVILVCMLLATGAGWLFCEKQVIEIDSEYKEQKYALDKIQVQNIELTENGLKIGVDPQIILSDLDVYVEKICINGLDIQEEVQVFYTENKDEFFSEQKSEFVVPEITKNGAEIELERSVIDLRIDFNGTDGNIYKVSSLSINGANYLEWNIGVAVFCALAGMVLGMCFFFCVAEAKNLKIYFMALKKYRFLLEDMVVRDIKLKYRRSIIGLLWSVLNPLLMMVVITAVFQNLFRFEIENFAVYYLTGWVVFNFVTEATSGAMTSVINASALIRKVYIPKYIFPMQKCFFSFVNMIFSLVALFVVMLVLKVKFTWAILLIPVPLLSALVFAIGLGMVLSTVAVFLRDMIHLYSVFTIVWMYLTPIIYPENILVGMMRTIMKLNPMYYYVDCFRKLTLYGQVPGIDTFITMFVCAGVSLLLGIIVFKKKQDRFILFI